MHADIQHLQIKFQWNLIVGLFWPHIQKLYNIVILFHYCQGLCEISQLLCMLYHILHMVLICHKKIFFFQTKHYLTRALPVFSAYAMLTRLWRPSPIFSSSVQRLSTSNTEHKLPSPLWTMYCVSNSRISFKSYVWMTSLLIWLPYYIVRFSRSRTFFYILVSPTLKKYTYNL